jgi:hypothetical protein
MVRQRQDSRIARGSRERCAGVAALTPSVSVISSAPCRLPLRGQAEQRSGVAGIRCGPGCLGDWFKLGVLVNEERQLVSARKAPHLA